MNRLLWALLIAIVSVAYGCAEPPHGITLWHPYRGAEDEALQRSVAAFEEETHLKVTTLFVPYEAYIAKLEAAIPRGNGPDVFIGPHNRIGEYVLHQLIGEAGDAFPATDVARYEEATVEAVTFRRKRWAVPLASKCVALYYDPRVYPEAPRSLEEIVAKKDALGAGRYPLAFEAESAYYFAGFLHAYGGKMFDAESEPGGFAMTGEGAEKALVKVRELVHTHVVPEEASGDLVKTLFQSGRAAAVMDGPWLAGDLKSDVPYRVAPLPTIAGAGPMRPYLTVDAAFLTPEGAKSKDAMALARFLGGDASARVRAVTGRQVVATKAFWSEEGRGARDDDLRVLRAFHDAGKDAIPIPVSTAMNPVWDPVKNAIRKVIRGQASPSGALEEAKARYADVMREPEKSSPAPIVVLIGLALLFVAFKIVQRTREPGFARELAQSKPAYKYVLHAAVVVFVLVVLPLIAGAITSFFAGARDEARFVGLANYVEILTARGKPLLSHGSFYLTLLVTVLWTVLNIAAHVGIGLVLGVLLARPMLKLRAVYRVLLVIPWAVPSYVTALAWKGMFHRQFGAVNAVLAALGVEPVSWFSKFSTAFTANVATNVWLGFPFMMVVVMGALTSISKDVLEAAEVDGATRWQTFRLVTLPLLKPTLLPAVILGTVWTFNMFNVVYLVSGGEPDGTTDILVSEAYRWAFARNAQLGYAAAYAVIIFGVLALLSRGLNRLAGAGANA